MITKKKIFIGAVIAILFLGVGVFFFSEETLPPITEIKESGKFGVGGKTCTFKRISENPLRTSAGESLHPSNIAGDPFVIFEDGKYRMWFTVLSDKKRLLPLAITYAESGDGITWDVWKKPESSGENWEDYLVLKPSDADWNSLGAETVSVIKAPDGLHLMYYTGDLPPEGSHLAAIGLATSPDGIHWTKYGDKPIFEAENEWEKPLCDNPADRRTCFGGPMEPSVIYDVRERRFKMWYAGIGKKDGVVSFRIGYAISPDGVNWTRQKESVLDKGGAGSWDELWVSHTNVVPDPMKGYHLFYFGTAAADHHEGYELQRGAIGHAYSLDGINWERDSNPVLAPSQDGWDAWTVGGPSVMFRNDEVLMWYFGQKDPRKSETMIGLARGKCG